MKKNRNGERYMETFLIDSKKEYLKVHFQLLSVESLTFSCENLETCPLDMALS